MNPLLLYFREEYIELWSLDKNGRLQPVMYNSSNHLPLYFLLSGEEILMNNYAKDKYLNNEGNAFGDFWKNLENNSISYNRFASNNSFSSLLPYTLKESVLPVIAKSHFYSNLSDFLKETNTAVLFDSFVEEKHKEIILNLFFEIIGFDPNSILSFDYFDSFKEIQIKYKAITQSDSFILANISCGNFYFHLIGKNSPLHLAKKVLEGKGQDPILGVVLDFLVEIAQAKGSVLKHVDLRKELKNDAIEILNKIPEGLVVHTVRNNNLDVNPLKISFHKNEIEGRINNRQSLNFIQNEFDTFRRKHNAEQLPIFLSGSIINQLVFREFFCNTYAKVNLEDEKSDSDFILACLSKIHFQDLSSRKPNIIDDSFATSELKKQLDEKKIGILPPIPSISLSVPPLPTGLKPPPLPPTKVSAPPLPPGVKPPPLPPTKLSPPPLPPGVKPPPVPPTKVSAPPLPPGVKPPPLPPTKVSAPPLPPGVKQPPVPPTKLGSPPVPPGVKPPPPPPPPPPKNKQ